jgi:selenocysteine-specific elongation factor
VDEVHRGQRAAVNLAGVHHETLERGQELCSPGHLRPSRLLTVRLSLLESAARGLKDRARIRVHIGTAELHSTVRLLGRDRLDPGDTAAAQLFLSEPAVAVWSQPLVVRSESPVVTIGGGMVLDPSAERIRKPDDETLAWIDKLASPDVTERASAALYFAGLRDWRPDDLPRTAGVEAIDAAHAALLQQGQLREIMVSPTRTFRLHQRVFDRLCERIEAALRKLHERFPLRTALDRSRLTSAFRYLGEEAVLLAALKEMQATGRIHLSEQGAALVGHGPKLSQSEQKSLAQLVEMFRTIGIQAPTVQQCQQQAPRNQQSIPQLLALAAANGELVEIAPDLYLHSDVERETRALLREELAAGEGLTISEIREILNTTRKYAVPLCEYLDRIGFTRRKGDLRVLSDQLAD